MRNTDFLRRNRLVCGLILSLGCPLASCEDTAGPATWPDRQPSSESDDEDAEESDEMTSSETAKPDAKASSGSRDASTATGGRNDAGLDASSAKSDAALAEDDAASSSEGVVDGGVAPTQDEDAGTQSDASTPSRDAATDSQDAQEPTATPLHMFKVDSKDEWTASGFQVKAGSCYMVTAKIDDKWLDLDVPADLSGWKNKNDSRLALFAPLRRVAQKDIGFYQFATCVDKKFDQCFPIGEMSSICPKASGELFFFVNDVAGFESNNVGTASVTIQAK